jgi:hypothetical protein
MNLYDFCDDIRYFSYTNYDSINKYLNEQQQLKRQDLKKLEEQEKESEEKQLYSLPYEFNKITNQESRSLFLNRQKVLRKLQKNTAESLD